MIMNVLTLICRIMFYSDPILINMILNIDLFLSFLANSIDLQLDPVLCDNQIPLTTCMEISHMCYLTNKCVHQ